MKKALNAIIRHASKHHILSFIAAILIACGSAVACYSYPPLWTYFVITDPHDPDFDPAKFHFEYYRSHKELAEFLRIHLPVGTPKAYVDQVLVAGAGATMTKAGPFSDRQVSPALGHGYDKTEKLKDFSASTYAIYKYSVGSKLFGWVITVYFDENNKIKLIVAGNEIIHSTGNR